MHFHCDKLEYTALGLATNCKACLFSVHLHEISYFATSLSIFAWFNERLSCVQRLVFSRVACLNTSY